MTVLMSDIDLDDAARNLAVLAAKLEQVDHDLVQRAAPLAWRGPAADRFAGQVASAHQTMDANIDQISAAARLLRTAADRIRAERVALGADQNLVETILRGEPKPADFLRAAGWTAPALPPTGDTVWSELAQKVVTAARRGAPPGGAPSGGLPCEPGPVPGPGPVVGTQ